VPTQTASAIQVAAAKRAILCELLVTGKVCHLRSNVTIADDQRLHLPKATPQVVSRAVEKNHGVYFKIAKAFEEKDWDIVEKVAEDDKTEFEKVRTLSEPILGES
jgi:COP9 signalosome complex subunit 3